jgi:predicted helicase
LIKGEKPQHVFIARTPVEKIFLSPKTSNNAFVFPLYLYDVATKTTRISFGSDSRSNFSNRFRTALSTLSDRIDLSVVDENDVPQKVNAVSEQVLHYLYAVLFSPTYRSRYAAFLKIDFPRLPITSNAALFKRLCLLGADLVALHLLEDDYQAASWNGSQSKAKSPFTSLVTRFAGKGEVEVAKGYPKYKDRTVYINPGRYFEGVPDEVWSFYVGGYKVCEKWLKDRRGRTLSNEDIDHYQRVIVSLNETIRLMAEIDRVIEEHGGWPLVGSQDVTGIGTGSIANAGDEADRSESLPFE